VATPSGSVFWGLVSNFFHYPLFGGLALLLAEAHPRAPAPERRGLVIVVLLVLAYGIVDELHQSTTPGRTPDPADVATDVLGAVGCLTLWWGVRGPGPRGPAVRRFLVVTCIALIAVGVGVLG
jgi:VanZ family protein